MKSKVKGFSHILNPFIVIWGRCGKFFCLGWCFYQCLPWFVLHIIFVCPPPGGQATRMFGTDVCNVKVGSHDIIVDLDIRTLSRLSLMPNR